MLGHKVVGVNPPLFNNSGPSLVNCRESPFHSTQVELRIIHWQGLHPWNLPPQILTSYVASPSLLDKNLILCVDAHDRIYCIKQTQLKLCPSHMNE